MPLVTAWALPALSTTVPVEGAGAALERLQELPQQGEHWAAGALLKRVFQALASFSTRKPPRLSVWDLQLPYSNAKCCAHSTEGRGRAGGGSKREQLA